MKVVHRENPTAGAKKPYTAKPKKKVVKAEIKEEVIEETPVEASESPVEDVKDEGVEE